VTPVGTVQFITVDAAENLTTQSPLASRSAVTPVVTSTVWLQTLGLVPVAVTVAAFADCGAIAESVVTIKVRDRNWRNNRRAL
jgi:hypothetical protein